MGRDYYFLLFISSAITFILGWHSAKLNALEKRIEALEGIEEEICEDPEEADSKKLDGNHRRDKPHLDAD